MRKARSAFEIHQPCSVFGALRSIKKKVPCKKRVLFLKECFKRWNKRQILEILPFSLFPLKAFVKKGVGDEITFDR